ncbi:hypothetical protein M405DRAFT_233135 [Rhizopogon salebrosus TDB-379]|nr:hypothetical protein M405DRAFT_233135 [Rhizopogon salebrosus TDB-379]
MRRYTSGCKPCFVFIEYATRIDLPDEVMSHPVIMAMEEATNDLVTWSNIVRTPPSSVRTLVILLFTGYFLLQRPRGEKSSSGRWQSISKGCRTGLSVLLTGPSTPPVISRRMGMLSSGSAWSNHFPKGPH